MSTTVTIAEDLADRIRPYESELPEILQLGIREWTARHESGCNGVGDVLEALAALPTPEEALALRPSPAVQERIAVLLEKSRESGLSPVEQREWDRYSYAEHLIRMAKASAMRKLKAERP